MSNQVDHYAREPRDRWHPDYESITEWLDTEAPVQPAGTKRANTPRFTRRERQVIFVRRG